MEILGKMCNPDVFLSYNCMLIISLASHFSVKLVIMHNISFLLLALLCILKWSESSWVVWDKIVHPNKCIYQTRIKNSCWNLFIFGELLLWRTAWVNETVWVAQKMEIWEEKHHQLPQEQEATPVVLEWIWGTRRMVEWRANYMKYHGK